MVIPKKFQLMGHQWTVEHVPGMIKADDGDECRGLCQFDKLTLKVNMDQPTSLVAHTYLHELTHAVLWTLGKNKLCESEGFVDSVAGAFAQALQSAE